MRYALVCFILAVSVPLARRASAGEGEWAMEGSSGIAMLRGWETTWWGTGVRLGASHGLTDSWTLRFGASYEIAFAPQAPHSPLSLVRGGLGLAWTFDILRVVPYLFASAEAAAMGSSDVSWRARLVVSAGIGARYLLSRSWHLGGEVEYGFFVPETASLPAHLLVSFLVSYVFF